MANGSLEPLDILAIGSSSRCASVDAVALARSKSTAIVRKFGEVPACSLLIRRICR